MAVNFKQNIKVYNPPDLEYAPFTKKEIRYIESKARKDGMGLWPTSIGSAIGVLFTMLAMFQSFNEQTSGFWKLFAAIFLGGSIVLAVVSLIMIISKYRARSKAGNATWSNRFMESNNEIEIKENERTEVLNSFPQSNPQNVAIKTVRKSSPEMKSPVK